MPNARADYRWRVQSSCEDVEFSRGAFHPSSPCVGFHNKTPRTGGAYKEWTLTSHRCGGWASEVKVRADLGSGGTCFLVGGRMSPCRVRPCWRGAEGSLGISFMWLLIHPSMGLYHHGLLTSQRPRLPIPSLWHWLNKGRNVEAKEGMGVSCLSSTFGGGVCNAVLPGKAEPIPLEWSWEARRIRTVGYRPLLEAELERNQMLGLSLAWMLVDTAFCRQCGREGEGGEGTESGPHGEPRGCWADKRKPPSPSPE